MTEIDEALQPILPRELTSISGDVRAGGPPPTPSLTEPYGIRLATLTSTPTKSRTG
jgi:lysine N-acyltransferase